MGELGDRAGELDAGRTAADDDEGQLGAALFRVSFLLGTLESQQHPPPDRGRVLKRLQAGRKLFPLILAEIGVARAGGEHQRVVADRASVSELHLLCGGIHPGDGGEQRGDLLVLSDQMADRPRDLGGRQRRRRDLVEQGLEKMMVALVDDGDAHRRLHHRLGEFQAAEPGADNNDMMFSHGSPLARK